MTRIDIASLREDYSTPGLMEEDMLDDPLLQFDQWMDDAIAAGIEQPNTMTLATATPDGAPSARVVLLKGVDRGGFVFYTNFNGQKGRDLAANPRAALVFLWLPLGRQVRVEGLAHRVSDAEADAYFATRPAGSKIGAWASPQSQVIESRRVLEAACTDVAERFPDGHIPRPPHWGGYRVMPAMIEFWQARENRLHDRLRYRKIDDAGWVLERLAP